MLLRIHNLTTHPYHIRTEALFFYKDPATTEIYTLSLHDALPISLGGNITVNGSLSLSSGTLNDAGFTATVNGNVDNRSEEHTSELQSRGHLVCRLLLEKKKKSQLHSPIYILLHHILQLYITKRPT